MSIAARVLWDGKSAQAFLDRCSKQTRFATAVALTRTAKRIETELKAEMPKVFDRPTRYTLNSLYTKPATKATLTASVKIKDEAVKSIAPIVWLAPQVYGGARPLKRSEALLRRAGVLGPSEYAVPAQGAKLDAYGNMKRSQIVAILSDVQAHFDPAQNSSRASRAKRARGRRRGGIYFAARAGGHLKPGVYERIGTGFGSAVRPVLIFVQGAPTYRKRLDFFGVGQRVIDRHYTNEFDRAMAHAIRTAA